MGAYRTRSESRPGSRKAKPADGNPAAKKDMMTPQPKTIAEHQDYLYKIVRLKLFFMHLWLTEHPEESPTDVLRNRIDIYRKTSANKGLLNPCPDWEAEEWQRLEHGILDEYTHHRHNAEKFEETAFAVVQPSLDARLEKDFNDKSGTDGYQCGCLRYDLSENPTVAAVGFHIANPLQPRSIFDNPLYLPCCLMILMDQVEALYQATEVGSFTWLNGNAKWLAVFPREWQESMTEPNTDVQWHYGFWGQFITGRGTFNDALGAYVRTHGKLKYYPRAAHCSIAVLRKHLLENMPLPPNLRANSGSESSPSC